MNAPSTARPQSRDRRATPRERVRTAPGAAPVREPAHAFADAAGQQEPTDLVERRAPRTAGKQPHHHTGHAHGRRASGAEEP
ncbi:hypothetical protein ACFPC0_00715 [Streptomyces andamanensis]|uniref:Uncharacterized protein n=1 Tax=Streptomyces andamanensis TaxID=1565035 RepID=A0ABV8T5G0_9ACTN